MSVYATRPTPTLETFTVECYHAVTSVIISYSELRPMTQVSEIGAENRYQKTSTGFWSVWYAVWYPIFPVPVFRKE